MYTISQFARKCNVSSKTLRHYEKIGLLIPASIGTENLYRYYSREQTEEVNLIIFLKELGIPLNTIKRILDTRMKSHEIVEEHRRTLVSQLQTCYKRLAELQHYQAIYRI